MLIKDTILWKILEPKEFLIRGLQEFIKRYILFGPFIIFTFFHLLLIIFIMMIPSILIKILLKIIGRDNIISEYNLKKNLMADFDMISRGSV
jgi:hypothetical protein